MKRIARILLLGLALAVPAGMAQAADFKVGFVNAQKLLENAPYWAKKQPMLIPMSFRHRSFRSWRQPPKPLLALVPVKK